MWFVTKRHIRNTWKSSYIVPNFWPSHTARHLMFHFENKPRISNTFIHTRYVLVVIQLTTGTLRILHLNHYATVLNMPCLAAICDKIFYPQFSIFPWWRHQMETFSALLALCAGNLPASGEFPAQRPVTRSFDVFFDLCLNKRLRKQSRGWWFETLSCPLWRHRNASLELGRLPRHKWTHPEEYEQIDPMNPLVITKTKQSTRKLCTYFNMLYYNLFSVL